MQLKLLTILAGLSVFRNTGNLIETQITQRGAHIQTERAFSRLTIWCCFVGWLVCRFACDGRIVGSEESTIHFLKRMMTDAWRGSIKTVISIFDRDEMKIISRHPKSPSWNRSKVIVEGMRFGDR